LDANKNGDCDTLEATASASAQGEFSLSVATGTQLLGLPLLAKVPAGTGGAAYILQTPASKASVVSPITTLVQTGVAQGMALADAESALAMQLQIQPGSLYNDYTANASSDSRALATIADAVIFSIRAGVPLDVSAPFTSAPEYFVRRFGFTNAQNFDLRYYYWTNVPNTSTGLYPFYVLAHGAVNGAPRSVLSGYVPTWVSTATGWVPSLNEANIHASTAGNPSVAVWGNGYRYVSIRRDIDVGGLSIAAVVKQAQDLTVNTEATLQGVNADQLSGTMPAGSKVRWIKFITTENPLSYRPSDGTVGNGASTVAGLTTSFPAPQVPAPGNTVSLGNVHLFGCPQSPVCSAEALRVAFSADNTANYYLCDLNTTTGTMSNCAAAGTGKYAIGTALDNTTPMMTFTNLPSTLTALARTLIERDGHVYVGTRTQVSAPAITTRLNQVAFEALAAAIGIAPPTIGASPSAFVGLWSATYSGSEMGVCEQVLVDGFGVLNGSCTSSAARTFSLTGSVSGAGATNFGSSGGADAFSGVFLTTSATGTWSQAASGASGSWIATKR
jgi:hypothetical protein